MIKLATKVETPVYKMFNHKSGYMLLGSCFAEHIGKRLSDYRFVGINNPFGILFNPMSIADGLERIIAKRHLTEGDIFFHNGLWHSHWYHGCYSDTEPNTMLQRLNDELDKAHDWLPKVDFLILTFGSSWVYEREGRVVANCHKLPENRFVRRRVSIDEIADRYKRLFADLFRVASQARIIISVSPVRYLGQGAFDNSINKATLLLAVEKLTSISDRLIYFPAYEILLDELRDYRFYDDDMIHPSQLTQTIIWQRFSESFFTKETIEILPKFDKLNKMLNHRIMREDSAEIENFISKIEKNKEEIDGYLASCGQPQLP